MISVFGLVWTKAPFSILCENIIPKIIELGFKQEPVDQMKRDQPTFYEQVMKELFEKNSNKIFFRQLPSIKIIEDTKKSDYLI